MATVEPILHLDQKPPPANTDQRCSTVLFFYNGCLVNKSNGSQVRASAALAFLVKIFDRVVFYSFSDHPTEPWTAEKIKRLHESFPTVTVVTELGTLARIATRLKNLIVKVAPGRAKFILGWHIPLITPLYDKLVRELPTGSLWWVNYADGLTQLNGIPSVNVVVETHDIKFLSHCKAKLKASNSFSALMKLRSEVGLLAAVKAVVAISPMEEAFFRLLLPIPIFYVPLFATSMSNVAKGAARVRSATPKYDLLFIASENILNVRGLIELYSNLGSWLRNRKVALAGNICTAREVNKLVEDFGIYSLGFVSDVSQLYSLTKACISPTDGTGLKMKVVEALQHGKPVFASQHSMDGLINGYQDCVLPFDIPTMSRILDNSEALLKAEKAATEYAQSLTRPAGIDSLTSFLRDCSA